MMKHGFTWAKENTEFVNGVSKLGGYLNEPNKLRGFTLAEVLITLAIIGVVAALTIPSVITNYKKNVLVTQLKKEYNYFTNAFHTAMARDGVTKLSDTKLISSIQGIVTSGPAPWNPSITINSTDNTLSSSNILKSERAVSREEFLKTFNIAIIYDGDQNKIPVQNNQVVYKQFNSTNNNVINNFVCLADGACFSFNFNKTSSTAMCGPTCVSLKQFQENRNTPTRFWQFIGTINVDVNGFQKGPNQLGRDYFVFYVGDDGNLYPMNGADYAVFFGSSYASVVEGTASNYWKYDDNKLCNPSSSNSGMGCAARVMEEGWKMNY